MSLIPTRWLAPLSGGSTKLSLIWWQLLEECCSTYYFGSKGYRITIHFTNTGWRLEGLTCPAVSLSSVRILLERVRSWGQRSQLCWTKEATPDIFHLHSAETKTWVRFTLRRTVQSKTKIHNEILDYFSLTLQRSTKELVCSPVLNRVPGHVH